MNSLVQKIVCSKADCTAATTGICLLGKPTPQECEHCSPVLIGQLEEREGEEIQNLQDGRTLHTGTELGTLDILQISRGSYTHVVGLMGPYNAGKTCFLLSLYLMASQHTLPGDYLFRRSLTLQGFEDRACKLRDWKRGALPEQLADHTSITDGRRPGFLHLGITRSNEPIDLLFPDLPGEWTTSLINRADTAKRWEFLKRADGIIVVLDGTELVGKGKYAHVLNAKHLLDRLKDTLQISADIPFVILVSKADEIHMKEPEVMGEIKQYAAEIGFAPRVILCSAFSRDPKIVPNGAGVVEAMEHIVMGTLQKSYIKWENIKSDRCYDTLTSFQLFKSQK